MVSELARILRHARRGPVAAPEPVVDVASCCCTAIDSFPVVRTVEIEIEPQQRRGMALTEEGDAICESCPQHLSIL